MAVVNPIGYLQNAGSVHTAEVIRAHASLLSVGRHSSGGLRPLGGVHREMGAGYVVQQAGAPNMSVDVTGGVALVPGTEGLTQGSYVVVNSATENLSIAAAHATLGRIDRVGVRVRDSAYSGVNNDGANVVITGTPSGSPAAPAEPNNFLTLALVSVPAADTTITNSQITDMRIGLAAPGGVVWCTSANRPNPASGQVLTGQEIYETDTTLYKQWDGTAWVQSRPWVRTTVLGSSAASVVFSNIPTALKALRLTVTARIDSVAVYQDLQFRIGGDTGANYQYAGNFMQDTTLGGARASAQTTGRIGFVCGTSVTSGRFTTAEAMFQGWNSPHANSLTANTRSGFTDTTAGNNLTWHGSATYHGANSYSSLTVLAGAGNLITGSQFTIEGWG
jgi:hypothetical protein